MLLTAGNINDISIARALLQRAGPVSRLLADRGYDANHLRRFLADQQAEAVIPSTTSRRQPIPYDTVAYRDRNRIERMWCRLKDWRRIATRYDKLARNFLSSAYLAAIFSCWTIESGPSRTCTELLRAVFLFLASGEAFPQAGDLEKNLAPHGVFNGCSLGPSRGGPLPEVFSAILLRVHDAAVR